jgi:hypothetical protein
VRKFSLMVNIALGVLGKHFATSIDGGVHERFALPGDAVTMRSGDFGDQTVSAQQVQGPRDLGRAPALLASVPRRPGEEHGLDVAIAEALEMMLATQDRSK